MAISRSKHRLNVDIESFSSFDLAESGVYRYVEAPDFCILLIGYSVDGGPVKVLDLTESHTLFQHRPDDDTEFKRYLFDPSVTKFAFNASFERTCLAKWYHHEMPPQEWRCTMVAAHAQGLPGSLGTVGMLLGLPQDKRKDTIGKRLIAFFCKPCKPTAANNHRTRNLPEHDPDKWQLFKEYNRQDVVAEMAIGEKLEAEAENAMPEAEWNLWFVDQQINDRGIRLDMDMVNAIVDYNTSRSEALLEEARELTGLENPNSLIQLKDWLRSQGIEMATVTKDTTAEILKRSDLTPDVRRALEIRQALGKSSVAKYTAMQNAVCQDGRLRGILQFYGAGRTGRWAGRIVQVHNLARNSLPDLDTARELVKKGEFDWIETMFGEPAFVFGDLVRTAFIPSDGCRFIVSDFSAIEARVIAWLAGQEDTLETFTAGKDIYCETASRMYGVPVVKHGINGELRQRGKIATLACGYGGGVGAMKRMDRSGSLPEEELQHNVDLWRKANPKIVQMWRDVERAAMYALRNPGKVFDFRSRLEFFSRVETTAAGNRKYDLLVRLPSGRCLIYADARITPNANGGPEITYLGDSKKEGYCARVNTYGGKLVENIVQATARDCLGEVMKEVTSMGYHIVMHVHDEIIVDVPIADKAAPDKIMAAMLWDDKHHPDWAAGLPLKGDMYECSYYRKD